MSNAQQCCYVVDATKAITAGTKYLGTLKKSASNYGDVTNALAQLKKANKVLTCTTQNVKDCNKDNIEATFNLLGSVVTGDGSKPNPNPVTVTFIGTGSVAPVCTPCKKFPWEIVGGVGGFLLLVIIILSVMVGRKK
jgi:hypothetical protein